MTKNAISVKKVVSVSFIVDIIDIVVNFTVALITGSVVVLAEFFQGLADLVAAGFLLIGIKRSERLENKEFAFGYGKEMFFWTLLSSLLMFTFTAGLSFYFGFRKFMNPEEISHLWLAFVALSIAVTTNSYAFSLSYRRLASGSEGKNIISKFLNSPRVTTKNTFVLDLMGTTAAVIGLISLTLYQVLGETRLDGLGAMAIGIIIAGFAFLLILAVKDMIIGKSAPQEVIKDIRKAVREIKEVNEIVNLRTMQIGLERYLLNLEVNLKDGLTTAEVEVVVDKIKERVKSRVSGVYHIQVEPETK
jgi:cation diffusion facilitator family transporter